MYDGKRAIGSAGLWQHDDEVCELIRVFIEGEYRGKGLAAQLIAEVEWLAKKNGYSKIMLRTWSSTPYAVRAYEKLGYETVPTHKFKYIDKFQRALELASLRVYMVKRLG